jgi:hypothetical protein
MPMFSMRQSPHFKRQSHLDVSVQDANRVGAKDARHPAVCALFTQHTLQDTKLASCEEQGPAS